MIKRVGRKVTDYIKRIPGMVSAARFCERRWPTQWARLIGRVVSVAPFHRYEAIDLDNLTSREQQIYNRLKTAIEEVKESH